MQAPLISQAAVCEHWSRLNADCKQYHLMVGIEQNFFVVVETDKVNPEFGFVLSNSLAEEHALFRSDRLEDVTNWLSGWIMQVERQQKQSGNIYPMGYKEQSGGEQEKDHEDRV